MSHCVINYSDAAFWSTEQGTLERDLYMHVIEIRVNYIMLNENFKGFMTCTIADMTPFQTWMPNGENVFHEIFRFFMKN